MLKWHKIEDVLPEGEFVICSIVAGRKVCLIRHQGKLHAVQNSCPHAGGVLSGGWCKEGHLVCPIHRWQYNLDTGRGATGQGDYINRYPLEQKEDGLYIGFRESFWRRFFR